MTTEPTNHEDQAEQQPKKVSLAEAAKQRLAQKKQAQGGNALPGQKHTAGNGPAMKSQNTKKVNNQRKRMGV
ncbi:hypothetical protein ACFO9Q_22575 [Paenibacillus sp. GCM10023252]|uniref:hypothetical protein n=1 Tax=Paenibacillus sp. GCM10023252 TaxID=3252649 RepID=UPI00360DDC3C